MDKRRIPRTPAKPGVFRAARLDSLEDMAFMRCVNKTGRSITDVIKAGMRYECETNGIPWPTESPEIKAS